MTHAAQAPTVMAPAPQVSYAQPAYTEQPVYAAQAPPTMADKEGADLRDQRGECSAPLQGHGDRRRRPDQAHQEDPLNDDEVVGPDPDEEGADLHEEPPEKRARASPPLQEVAGATGEASKMEEDTEPPSSMPEPSEPPASTDLNLDLVPLKQEKPFSCSRPAEDGDNAGAAAAVVGPSSSSAAAASSSLSSPPAPPSPSSAELDHIFQHDRKLDARARKTALQGGISHELSLELHLLAQAGDVPAMDRLSAIRVAHADRERSKQRQGPPPGSPSGSPGRRSL